MVTRQTHVNTPGTPIKCIPRSLQLTSRSRTPEPFAQQDTRAHPPKERCLERRRRGGRTASERTCRGHAAAAAEGAEAERRQVEEEGGGVWARVPCLLGVAGAVRWVSRPNGPSCTCEAHLRFGWDSAMGPLVVGFFWQRNLKVLFVDLM